MTPTPYPPGVEDALRTAWCMTCPAYETGVFMRAPMCGTWTLDIRGAKYALIGASHSYVTWTSAARAAVDALPEYQAWRASIDKKEGE